MPPIAAIFSSIDIAQHAKSVGLGAKELDTAQELNIQGGFMPADQKLKSYKAVFTNEYVK